MKYLWLLLLLPSFALANDCPPGHANNDSCVDGGGDVNNDIDLDLDNDIDLRSSTEINNGDVSLSSKDSSRYFAFGTSFPNAEGCLGGVQVGFGLYGQHKIDNSCWIQKLADSEKNVDLKARLKCADKKYRKAIAYNVPWHKRKERRQACINYVSAIWILEIQKERELLNKCQKASCTYVNGQLRLEYYDE